MEVFFLFRKFFISLIAIVLFTSTSFPKIITAFTPEETIEQSKIEYDTLDSEILELNSKISTLDIEIEELTNTLDENNLKISNIETEIKHTEDLLVQNKKDIEESQNVLDTRVRSMYKSNMSTSILVSIITSENIFDMISRVKYIYDIVEIDREVITEINAKKEELNATVEKLNVSQKDLLALKKSTEDSILELEDKKSTHTTLLDELNSEKDAIFAVIEENEQKLVAHPISIIDSSNNVSELEDAIITLNSLIQQLNSSYVIGLCEDAIYKANLKIDELTAPIAPPPSSGNDNSGSGGNDSSGDGSAIKTFTMESTAYTGGGLTAMGIKPVRIPGGISTVAVDPNVIPLGSKFHVSGYGYAIAADTGGAVKGNIVDVYLNSYNECINWGRRNVTVKLIAYPGQW